MMFCEDEAGEVEAAALWTAAGTNVSGFQCCKSLLFREGASIPPRQLSRVHSSSFKAPACAKHPAIAASTSRICISSTLTRLSIHPVATNWMNRINTKSISWGSHPLLLGSSRVTPPCISSHLVFATKLWDHPKTSFRPCPDGNSFILILIACVIHPSSKGKGNALLARAGPLMSIITAKVSISLPLLIVTKEMYASA